jgi:3-oxoacyl-[acyl-carrier-protein] synthase-3
VRRARIESLGVSPPRRTFLFRKGSLSHAVAAGRAALRGSSHRPSEVRVLVNVGVHKDDHVCEPAFAAYVQHRLGINVEFQGPRTLSFDLHNGACGTLNGLHLAANLVAAGEVGAGLVVASEANTDRRPDPSWTWAASGAAALVDLGPEGGPGFGAFAFHTDDRLGGALTSTVRLDVARGRLVIGREPGLEEAWIAGARAAAAEALERDRLGAGDVDLVVPAQVSAPFLARLPGALGLPAERILDLTARLPDTHSTSVLLALRGALDAGRLPPGRTALLLGFGSGVTVAAATYHL